MKIKLNDIGSVGVWVGYTSIVIRPALNVPCMNESQWSYKACLLWLSMDCVPQLKVVVRIYRVEPSIPYAATGSKLCRYHDPTELRRHAFRRRPSKHPNHRRFPFPTQTCQRQHHLYSVPTWIRTPAGLSVCICALCLCFVPRTRHQSSTVDRCLLEVQS